MIRYPNTRVRISKHFCLEINFQKNAVLEQTFIKFQDYSNHSLRLTLTNCVTPLCWVLLCFERLSKETSSLQLFGGRNQEDLSVAASSISQNCKWGRQCKVWLALIKKLKLWKNSTPFMTLTNNYAHAIMKQKKTKIDYLRGLSVFVFIVNKLGPFEKPFINSSFVFHQDFQTLENNKSTRPSASCFHQFSRVWKPWWNTRSSFYEIVLLYPQFTYMIFIYVQSFIHHFTGLSRTDIMCLTQNLSQLWSLNETDVFLRRYNITTRDVPRGFTARNNHK